MNNKWNVFVISLQDAVRRRDRLIGQLNSAGLDYEIFDAVDGRQGLPSAYEHMVDRKAMIAEFGRVLTDAECACAISHQLVYNEIIKRGLKGAVILEDDATWTNGATRVVEGLLQVMFIFCN